MVFNSLPFLVYFFLVTSLYFIVPHSRRWLVLLIASCYFYITFLPIYILVLGGTIVIDYYAGIYLERLTEKKARKRFLILSLAANIGVLAVFKYYNFFAFNINVLLQSGSLKDALPYLKILLPIGLSFHTFQAMSYTIEVYRGNQKAEKHFGYYALYVMFYPQLVAGPIERPQNTLHQFHEEHFWDWDEVKAGLLQMAQGFFKKVVIADRLAILVDGAYTQPSQQTGASLLLATLMYSFQIYCDFSGYSDIGIGAARVMGFKLMTNFRSPYFSRSISEFWSRWHISLSTWFRDYLYIPLGGNRVPVPRWFLNLLIVFLVSGLWHGASWNFIIWGAIHGLLLIITILINKALQRAGYSFKPNPVKTVVQIVLTFLLVSFAWIFFRAASLSDAVMVINKIFSPSAFGPAHLDLNSAEIYFALFAIAILCLVERYFPVFRVKNNWLFGVLFVAAVFACYLFGVFNNRQFIYFQF